MLIETTLGLMDTDELEERQGVSDDDEWRRVSWREFWHDGVLVRRDAHLEIKKFPPMSGELAQLG